MNSLWIVFEKATGQIIKMSPTKIDNNLDTRCSINVPDEMLFELVTNNSIDRLYADFKASLDGYKLVLNDNRETIVDKHYNKVVAIPYIHRSHTIETDLRLEITSVDNKPVLKVSFVGNPLLRANRYRNKELIHLTAKNDINKHYQSFEIDLTKIDNEVLFDIDRCDYRLLFSNQISFYHRKKLNTVYTIT